MKNLVFVAIVFMLLSCKENVKESIYNIKWELVELKGDKLNLDSLATSYIKLSLEDQRVTGKAMCNRFFGNYKIDGADLKIGPLGATRMACKEIDQERLFFDCLDRINVYRIKGDTLMLFYNSDILLKFVKRE